MKVGFLGGAHSVRPRGKTERVPRDSVSTGWPSGAWSPTGTCLGQAQAPLRACGARPSRGAKPGTNGLARKTRRQRERWFSRRDAVSASAKPGRTQAEEQHDHGGANEHPVAQGGHARVNPTVSLRACGARPSRGAKPGTNGLAGKTRRQRERWFSRRDALRASALQGRTHAEAFHYPRWVPRWP